MVEFVLVLLPLVVFVGGIIQLGIGVADWHDLNRIANEGARFAAVEEWPGCPATETTCTENPACDASSVDRRTLLNYLRCEVVDAGLGPTSVVVQVCSPVGSPVIGDPITVRLTSRLNFLSLDNSDPNDPHRINWLGVTLRGTATMRIETAPTKYTTTTC